MATFMTEDFLLKNDIARTLYHKYAAPMPIYDFHCHLSPQEIADDRRFDNLGQIWLEGDHYKWRALRSAGVDESLITGKETSDYEKYMAWANTVPKTLGNPLYHWTHLELRRPFGITGTLFGPDTGFDSIGDNNISWALSRLLDSMDVTNELPKTILYCLNPRDNEVLATMIGNFQGPGIAGKVQFGSGWWFNDQKDGMLRQLEQLSQMGLLSQFVGMLTDSRSFLSYTRHEYFRRILCNLLGQWAQDGEIPDDEAMLSRMVQDICFNNAQRYFTIK
ncbi:glucuronate isomerase [Salmonella enterica]|nr:glucuronate isomerase [Salmonella enterica]